MDLHQCGKDLALVGTEAVIFQNHGQVGDGIFHLAVRDFLIPAHYIFQTERFRELAIHIAGVDALIPAACTVRIPASGVSLTDGVVHIVIVVIDGGDDRLLRGLLYALGNDPQPAELGNGAEQHQQDQHDSKDHGGALAGATAKDMLAFQWFHQLSSRAYGPDYSGSWCANWVQRHAAHFQYTSDLPVAEAVSVIGNEPNPPNRPISVSSVRVTVTSSLSWMRPVVDHRMSGLSPVLSVSAAARREIGRAHV